MDYQKGIDFIRRWILAAEKFYDENPELQTEFPDKKRFVNDLLDPLVKTVKETLHIDGNIKVFIDAYKQMLRENNQE